MSSKGSKAGAKAPASFGASLKAFADDDVPRFEPPIETTLASLERAFKAGDKMAGLSAAKKALENHLPVPRRIAEWLAHAISLYTHERCNSIDAGLGLNARGKANPRRRQKAHWELQVALGKMLWLHFHGATIDQAAALVARVTPSLKHATLAARYTRGGYGKIKQEIAASLVPCDPEATLAEYPDDPLEVEQAKSAIRKVYAKKCA